MEKNDTTNPIAGAGPDETSEAKTDSKLIEHAKRELELAGLTDADADYGGATATAVLELIRTFSKQGHSGGSAAITLQVFMQLASYEILLPPTDDPDEWEDRSLQSGYPLWQNKRGSAYFSTDGGKNWKHIKTEQTGKSVHKKVDIIKKPD